MRGSDGRGERIQVLSWPICGILCWHCICSVHSTPILRLPLPLAVPPYLSVNEPHPNQITPNNLGTIVDSTQDIRHPS
jgi:hypothetical protein